MSFIKLYKSDGSTPQGFYVAVDKICAIVNQKFSIGSSARCYIELLNGVIYSIYDSAEEILDQIKQAKK